MTTQQENKQVTISNNFLTKHEQTVCMQLAKSESPHSQRALALLALNEENTQGQAAERSGLSAGQVKYWAVRFRNHRLGIFPDALLEELSAKADGKPAKEIEAKSKSGEGKTDSAKTKSKGDKGKKDKKNKKKGKKSGKKTDKTKKGEKKSKKDKKDKKGKKGKKPKKKAG